jgi:hypothetical protein
MLTISHRIASHRIERSICYSGRNQNGSHIIDPFDAIDLHGLNYFQHKGGASLLTSESVPVFINWKIFLYSGRAPVNLRIDLTKASAFELFLAVPPFASRSSS